MAGRVSSSSAGGAGGHGRNSNSVFIVIQVFAKPRTELCKGSSLGTWKRGLLRINVRRVHLKNSIGAEVLEIICDYCCVDFG